MTPCEPLYNDHKWHLISMILSLRSLVKPGYYSISFCSCITVWTTGFHSVPKQKSSHCIDAILRYSQWFLWKSIFRLLHLASGPRRLCFRWQVWESTEPQNISKCPPKPSSFGTKKNWCVLIIPKSSCFATKNEISEMISGDAGIYNLFFFFQVVAFVNQTKYQPKVSKTNLEGIYSPQNLRSSYHFVRCFMVNPSHVLLVAAELLLGRCRGELERLML